jgi:glyoxylase-like metal-dependent hydrolase (beta-lactamase superfamily II)
MLHKLSETIYYLSHQDSDERPLLGLVCGDQYSLVIDAGNSVQHAKDFLEEIAKLDVPPVKFLVITHGHWDHFLGMNEFTDTTVIVNSLTKEIMSAYCKKNHNSEPLNPPQIVFEERLTLDLGNKICVLERINSTHTDDSTIVYVPDEKVLFLGDSAYGKTTNSLFHYKQSHLIPMIEDIRKYDASHFLLGHETICDLDEMNLYFQELLSTSEATQSASLDSATERFENEHLRKANENERFFLQAFVNDRVLASQKK